MAARRSGPAAPAPTLCPRAAWLAAQPASRRWHARRGGWRQGAAGLLPHLPITLRNKPASSHGRAERGCPPLEHATQLCCAATLQRGART